MKPQKTMLRRHQRGVANVEFALILPILVLLLAFVVFFGRLCWHYTVAVKAASDMATFISLARSNEMLEARPDLSEIGIVKLARVIGDTELAELRPGNGLKPVIDITCDGGTCRGAAIPNVIFVQVQMRMYAPFLPDVLVQLGDLDGMWVWAEVRMRYAGA